MTNYSDNSHPVGFTMPPYYSQQPDAAKAGLPWVALSIVAIAILIGGLIAAVVYFHDPCPSGHPYCDAVRFTMDSYR